MFSLAQAFNCLAVLNDSDLKTVERLSNDACMRVEVVILNYRNQADLDLVTDYYQDV